MGNRTNSCLDGVVADSENEFKNSINVMNNLKIYFVKRLLLIHEIVIQREISFEKILI